MGWVEEEEEEFERVHLGLRKPTPLTGTSRTTPTGKLGDRDDEDAEDAEED